MAAEVTVSFTMDHPQLPGLPMVVDWPTFLGLIDKNGQPVPGLTGLKVDVQEVESPADPGTAVALVPVPADPPFDLVTTTAKALSEHVPPLIHPSAPGDERIAFYEAIGARAARAVLGWLRQSRS